MAKNKVYLAEFDADESPYVRKLKAMDEQTKKYTSKMQGYYNKMNSYAMGMLSGAVLIGAGKSVIEAFKQQELAVKRLEVAIGRNVKGLTDYAGALQKVTTFGDEAILDAMALIANYVKEEATIKKLTKATLNLAVAKGMDLSSAAELVAKSVGSSTNALSRYGIELDKNKTGTERVNELIEKLAVFSGQAEGQVNTLSGKFENLNNAISDNAEALGEKLLPYVNTFLERLNSILNLVGSSNFDKLIKFMPQIGFAMQPGQMSKQEFQEKWNNSLKNSWFNIGGGTPKYFLGPDLAGLKNDRNLLEEAFNNAPKRGGKNPVITSGTKSNNEAWQLYLSNLVGADSFGDATGKGLMKPVYTPPFIAQMNETVVPELQDKFNVIGDSFVNKFAETQNIAGQVGRIFNVSADSFVGKLMQAFDVGSSILSIIASIGNIASGGITSLFGLADGGTVINKGGKLSYTPIPKFARGGTYMVPPGYSNDSGLIRVQSGERVDVTPAGQVPQIKTLLESINNKIGATNANLGRMKQAPVVAPIMIDGKEMAKIIITYQNRLSKAGLNFSELT